MIGKKKYFRSKKMAKCVVFCGYGDVHCKIVQC